MLKIVTEVLETAATFAWLGILVGLVRTIYLTARQGEPDLYTTLKKLAAAFAIMTLLSADRSMLGDDHWLFKLGAMTPFFVALFAVASTLIVLVLARKGGQDSGTLTIRAYLIGFAAGLVLAMVVATIALVAPAEVGVSRPDRLDTIVKSFAGLAYASLLVREIRRGRLDRRFCVVSGVVWLAVAWGAAILATMFNPKSIMDVVAFPIGCALLFVLCKYVPRLWKARARPLVEL